MMNAIIIPIYKSDLDSQELISLKRCFSILGKHTIIFVAPEGLDVSYYEKEIEQKINVERFDKSYFADIAGYNTLMLSKIFYERFLNFEYILIYQLDCYVFRDELDYWCQQGYDYIGAPWIFFDYYKKSKIQKFCIILKRIIKNKIFRSKTITNNDLINKVGNGGFSLRKTSTFLKTIIETKNSEIQKFTKNNAYDLYNEDTFWSFHANKITKPKYKKAAKFSLETRPDIGIKLNLGKTPFGCHAWKRHQNQWPDNIIFL